jgi:hypothetical protein
MLQKARIGFAVAMLVVGVYGQSAFSLPPH